MYPYVSLCIPTPTPFCLIRREKEKYLWIKESFCGFLGIFVGIIREAILAFYGEKRKNKKKNGKFRRFLGISGDFRGFHRDNQGEFPFLFAGIKEK